MSREQGQAPRKAVRPPLSARCLVVWRFARSKARSADAGTRRDRSNVAIHQHNPKIHLREMSCAVTPCTYLLIVADNNLRLNHRPQRVSQEQIGSESSRERVCQYV